jgi:starvation-inducible DNA-binding protein
MLGIRCIQRRTIYRKRRGGSASHSVTTGFLTRSIVQTQCKYAHWNVKGPNFIALHELFDKINEDVEDYVDLIAERAVQLGGTADGTARMIVIAIQPAGVRHLAAFGTLARRAIDASNEVNDADTADIFTEISRGVDKWLWMVEAHLEA